MASSETILDHESGVYRVVWHSSGEHAGYHFYRISGREIKQPEMYAELVRAAEIQAYESLPPEIQSISNKLV